MKIKQRNRQGWPWQWMLIALFVWLLPQRAAATHVDDTYKYQVMLSGSNTIRISAPVYDMDGADCWVDNGNLNVTWTDESGTHTETCFHWQRNGDTDNDNTDIYIHFRTDMGGSIEVTQGNSSNHFTLTKADGDIERLVYRNSDGKTFNVYAVWRVPYALMGKQLTFKWDVHRDGNSRDPMNVKGLEDVPITMPDAQEVVTPQVTTATLSYSESGKLELPWFIASNKLMAARYEYTDQDGKTVTQNMSTDANSGTIYLDATVPHDNFRIIVSYKDRDDNLIENVSSTVQNLSMIHAPMGLTAIPTGNSRAAVRLMWDILYPGTDDITSTDFFEIQRSLTGKEEDFVTIGSVPFVVMSDNMLFEFTDSTLVEAVAAEQLTGGGTLEGLTYRVRRMITQNWGWDGNNCAQTTSCVVDDIHLLRIASYDARWEDERAYTVRVTWDYANEHNAVWDDRAQMKLSIAMKNRAGEVVDSILYDLNADERQQRYKVVTLSRPCIDYDIKVYVDRGTSPIHLWEELTPYYFPIRTSADWDTFRQKVIEAKGQYDVNARLYADISTVKSCGSNSAPFMGHFDGNGHTINGNINSSDSQALFLQVNGATITNLKLTGTITGSRGCGGLIGGVAGGDNRIESCHSYVTVNSTADGDGTNGGFVGIVGAGTLTMTNCAFYGTMAGANCTNNGGFIGWIRNVNGVMVTLTNCLFAPEAITTKLDGCQTFARTGSDARLKLINCQSNFNYYYEPLPTTVTVGGTEFFIIRNATDWQTFASKVNAAQGNSDVNAILYDDITVTSTVGIGSAWFRGIFDGNGHTLNLNITTNEDYTAPFRYAGNATFRNLIVAGSVSGSKHASGLVGFGYDAYTLDINNVRVSATVTVTLSHVGGFVGHAHRGRVNITDCLFDGKLAANGTNSYGGAFCGWGDGGTWIYDRLYENGSGEGISHFGYCYQGGSALGGGPTCYSAHNWAEMSSDANRNVTDQSKAVELLGSQWQLVNGKAVPIAINNGDDPEKEVEVKTADELLAALGIGWKKEGNAIVPVTTQFADPAESYPTPTLPTFHHESIGKIDPTLKTETRQSSVLLVWETDGNPIDFFTVLRRPKGTDDSAWKEVETNIDQLSYEDKTVSPLEDYEYKVRATSDCEGQSYTETQVTAGACKHTGLLEGYVRFNDGTGVPDITVEVVPQGGGTALSVKTDECGYFKAEDLSYMGQQSVTYIVTPVSEGNIRLDSESYSVTFNAESNHRQVHEFTITNGMGFSAYVMYDGTSIPVKGARFMVNGRLMHNAAGALIETDFEGRADFQVLGGVRDTIQVVMPGHTFVGEGYYKSPDGVVLTDKVSQTYFYDATLVKLTGRVVGGKDQGALPLDNNLSRNNLGDNLTMVLTLEGDNTSWLVYDNQNPAQSTRQLTIDHPGGGHQTVAEVQRKRMVVKPDSVTGEYVLMLPPVRWKVQQVYCEGYPTLFQDGQVSEVIDLTERLTPDTVKYEGTFVSVDNVSVYQPQETYNYRYDRIYHAPVEITYRQVGYDTFDYFGDKSYIATNLSGDKVEVPLAFQSDVIDRVNNPYDTYTFIPTLTPDGTSHTVDFYEIIDGNFYENLFDGNSETIWQAYIKSKRPWVQFKTDHPVSLKEYVLTTVYNTNSSIWTPNNWILKARAQETDEWVVIDNQSTNALPKNGVKAVTFPVSDHSFYQYFRLEINGNDGGSVVQLAEVQLVCRGNADNTPDEDRTVTIYGGPAHYTFGYPVFSLERRYPIEIQVAERYLYNNDARANKVDLVAIGGGEVTVHNNMKSGLQRETVELDENGRGIYYLSADQTTRLLTGEDALKTLTMTLTQDGTTYEAIPLKGYVLNMFAMSGSMDAISVDKPLLIDILRDPPGSASTATLSKGSKLKYNYTVDMKFQAGVKLSFGTGTALDNYSGMVAAPTEYGIINSGKSENWVDLSVIFSGSGKKAYSYTMNVGEDITTSSSATMIGADADLYIGVVQNMMVTPMSTIRAIPDNMYRQMLGRTDGSKITVQEDATGMSETITSKYGTLVHIAEGRDANDSVYHLVRDESLGYGPKVSSQFIHSQKYILSELLPKLADEILALIFTGTREEAKRQADATGKVVYWSKVARDDANFGLDYEIIEPAISQGITDEVAQKLDVFKSWIEMIGVNESEKLCAYDLVANYDVDGGSKVTYNETFESEYSVAQNLNYPFTTADYFGEDGINDEDRLAAAGAVLLSQPALATVFKMLSSKLSFGKVTGDGTSEDNKVQEHSVKLEFAGTAFNFGITPVVEYSSTGTYGSTHNYTRKESFTISMDAKSHLLFDVYRVMTEVTDTTTTSKNFDVFHNDNFDDWLDIVNNHVNSGVNYTDVIYPRSFVYRTRGGATANVWEDERRTQVYHPGTILDERTKKISNPKITLDRQSVSGVAIGDPARFKVYLTNESEQPEAATGGLTMFTFIQDMESNPKGAKILIDGAPLTGSGMTVVLYPGKVMEKTMEVYAGEEFDYEGLKIGVASQGDFANTQDYVTFDVHYLHEAGPVLIAQPGDKWVLNTNAQYDEKHGWFLPVTINGFNKHQFNFDHIEFQYKESLRGDDAWTNLCSYYADSLLMAQASGVKEMIPENGNIKTHFYGEGTVMEKPYDLRAVLYCRNGNSFLTTASPIISGVKDTRRPQLFGTPEPKSGLLTLGDDIIFNFSEDIEYNYLNDLTNFEVKGEVNNDNVAETVSLLFDGKASVETEARRNFSGKSLTVDMMVKPDETGRGMPLFSHGTNGKRLQLWLTDDFRLKAVVDDQEYTSTEAIVKGAFTQVAMSIDREQGTLTFYNGGKTIGTHKMAEPYNGTGILIFGRTNENDPTESSYYQGRMMEARLWYRAMTGGQVGTTYGSKRLTGYEMGLVDYYPMNEGMGDYALDKTQGANATLKGASWAMPRGLSLRVENDDKGIALTQDALNRTAEQDYTLMMWFKTDVDGRGVLLSNGAGRSTEINAENQFCLGFEAEKLLYKTHGMTVEVPGDWSDGQWHHLAMTVNRSFNVANIYVDQTLRTTFAADSLGGISGGLPLIGAARYSETDNEGHVATIDTHNWLTGNVDELCLFEQALPLTLIQSYATRSPKGDEVGLLTYLAFDRQERQKDNDLELMPYPYSKKLYLDDNGDVRYELDPASQMPTSTPIRDYLFEDSVSVILQHITSETAAPVVPNEELKNLNFSFVGEGHKVLVNLNESNARLNRRNIYVTLREVEDKNGNAMASPQTACYYVTNSSLQWFSNRSAKTVAYGKGETLWFSFCNNSAVNHTYSIENCPSWLIFENYTDRIAPQDFATLMCTVSKDLNVGSYDEVLYLTDEEGVSEPLYLTLTVEAEQPEWAWSVGSELLENSMNIVGRVFINDEIDIDSRDIVGVFDRQNVCHGFSNVSYSARTGESNVYLTVYDDKKKGCELYFKLWQYSTGLELTLTADGRQTMIFKADSIAGFDIPVVLKGGANFVQVMELKEGWNWISFNVKNEQMEDFDVLLNGLPWQERDILTELNGQATLLYENGHWISTDSTQEVRLSHKFSYAVKVAHDIQFPIGGEIIKAQDERTIWVDKGWNAIGYTPMLNLTVETALSDYYDKATEGDVIKSHKQFAYFTKSGGVGRWRGNLEYMKPGEGYMLLRKADGEASFRYPFYEPGSTFLDAWTETGSSTAAPARAKTTMTVSVVVDGFETQEGDRLMAYANGECVGEALVPPDSYTESTEPLYMSIGGDMPAGIWFAIERDGKIIAATGEQMEYKANGVIGSPDEPTKISFLPADCGNGKWYTVSGIQLLKRPTTSGVYIFNGKKVIIK